MTIENNQAFFSDGFTVWMNNTSDEIWTTLGSQAASVWSTRTVSFTIPANVPPGQKRIRVMLQYNKVPATAYRSANFTGNDNYGEWEEVLVYTCPSVFTTTLAPNPADTWFFQEARQTLNLQSNLSTLKSKVTAGQAIEMKPGFEVSSGGTFLAQIQLGCPLQP